MLTKDHSQLQARWYTIFVGTRFRHFDSPKQGSGHISEVSTSLSSQSGKTYCTYYVIPVISRGVALDHVALGV